MPNYTRDTPFRRHRQVDIGYIAERYARGQRLPSHDIKTWTYAINLVMSQSGNSEWSLQILDRDVQDAYLRLMRLFEDSRIPRELHPYLTKVLPNTQTALELLEDRSDNPYLRKHERHNLSLHEFRARLIAAAIVDRYFSDNIAQAASPH